MFDITSSKLLILGIVALLVIGPKDLPALLRTIGKYMGIIKRQAAEVRAQFEEALRDSELQQLKKEVETVGQEAEASVRAAEQSVDSQLTDASQSVEAAMGVRLSAGAAAAAVPAAGRRLRLPGEAAGVVPRGAGRGGGGSPGSGDGAAGAVVAGVWGVE